MLFMNVSQALYFVCKYKAYSEFHRLEHYNACIMYRRDTRITHECIRSVIIMYHFRKCGAIQSRVQLDYEILIQNSIVPLILAILCKALILPFTC